MRDSADCFPAWDPTDGATGNWNSEYDLLQIINGSKNVWVDHSHFTDAPNLDILQPLYFGRPYQVHDGAVDVTNGSDLVTMSYNRFSDHDKLLLIGFTDSTTRGDVGKLRVTIHHNIFEKRRTAGTPGPFWTGVTGDRAVLRNVRCLGNQDTLLVDSSARGVQARSYIEGDVTCSRSAGSSLMPLLL